MRKASGVWVFLLVVVGAAAVLMRQADAVTCSPLELSPCISAITSPSTPSPQCCSKVREQRPCLCGYLKTPSIRPYVDSPTARQIAISCAVPFPQC
ncbi:hypothetical protein SAY87_026621 [Trapa incisa]|uniref:Bifunctional inhibitor/plant lipid transfer protein/seed storage helical domain-containing protein n=1 Tax=Trapa incisa TaxID=236973 RepID=A0AAN7H428_9MYRT|nr:hypothetical protein SAY87_026621 [Trapa incisa]